MENVKKQMSFRCRNCHNNARIAMVDDEMERVECSVCGNSVEGENARIMYRTLAQRLAAQEGRNVARRIIRESKLGNIMSSPVASEFSDPRWPFILIVKGDA